MKLYYSPAAGSLASHITIRELHLDVKLIKVDLPPKEPSHITESGEDFMKINPKGYVPYLTIDQDTSLSEGAAILLYLADQIPEGNMAPSEGTNERYKLQQWLTFVGTEIQRLLGLFFVPHFYTNEGLEFFKAKLQARLGIMDNHLANNEYLMGTIYTVADAYAFAILNWIPQYDLNFVDMSSYNNLGAYLDKIRCREAVQTALKEEGLLE